MALDKVTRREQARRDGWREKGRREKQGGRNIEAASRREKGQESRQKNRQEGREKRRQQAGDSRQEKVEKADRGSSQGRR